MNRDIAGIYEATIVDNDDPEYRNRVRVRVPQFHGVVGDRFGARDSDLPWAQIINPPFGEGQGEVKRLQRGASVAVAFLQGHADAPLVLGSWMTTLDARNASQEGYVNGDASTTVEGSTELAASGSSAVLISGSEEHMVEGTLATASRRSEEVVTGAKVLECGAENVVVNGDANRTIHGAAQTTVGNSASLAVLGKAVVSISDALQVLAIAGFSLDSYLTPIRLNAANGQVELAVSDPTGLVELGSVAVLPTGDVCASAPTTVQLGSLAAMRPSAFGDACDTNFSVLYTFCQSVQLILAALGVPVPVPIVPMLPVSTIKVKVE